MTTKTLISLSRANEGKAHNIVLNYDDATVEAITDAAIHLIRQHRLAEGDTLTVGTIEVGC